MKAIRFHEYGGPEVLRYEEAPTPAPGPGEVRLRVAASAFNPLDAGLRGGWVRDAFPLSLPHIPGYDVAGTVDALGEGVTETAVGDAVVAFLPMTADGAAAQFVIAPADALASAPTSIPLADAAALPSTATTAWQALFEAGDLRSGQRVLITGAGGAVGGFAVQLASEAGAHVVAVTTADRADALREAGAEQVLDRSTGPVRLDAPVDVLLNLGRQDADAFAALVTQVRAGGVVVNTVPSVPTPDDPDRDVRGVGFFVRSDAAVLKRLVAMVDRGALRVEVAERLPLAELPDVDTRSDAGELRGKVLLLPPADQV